VASSNTGGWVRRVGSAGGGKTYRRRRPINYYGVITAVCVLGVSSVALARYDYRHPSTPANHTTAPTTSDKWFAALGISTCGTQQPALAANGTTSSGGFTAQPGGVIRIAPATAAQTGKNATLAAFVSGYHGLTVTTNELILPAQKKGAKPLTFKNGQKCPAGTKDQGKVGHVAISYWANLSAAKQTTTNQAALVKFSSNQLITIGFLPAGQKLPKPPNSAIAAMLQAPNARPTPTTTLPVPTTTLPTTTTTKG
jgi:hypothetical protein